MVLTVAPPPGWLASSAVHCHPSVQVRVMSLNIGFRHMVEIPLHLLLFEGPREWVSEALVVYSELLLRVLAPLGVHSVPGMQLQPRWGWNHPHR